MRLPKLGIEELLGLAKALSGKHDRLLACRISDTLNGSDNHIRSMSMLNHKSIGTSGLRRTLGVVTLVILGTASCGGGSSGTSTSSTSSGGVSSGGGTNAATVYSGCAAPTTPQHVYYSDPVHGSMAND